MTTVPLLEAERLTVRRAGRAVLDDVSMAVAGGDMVALYGPSGSGKSTLLAVLAGLEPPDEGEVRFEGRDLHGLPAEQRRALRRGRIALVLQAYGLLALLTVRENVELAQRLSGRDLAQARAAATGWLEELGLAGRAEHRAEELSGGEQQRVALARALAGGADLLLADEPTAELDEANRDRALALLRAAADQGTAVVVATHDPAVVACCDRMLRLTDGRVPPPADPPREER
jgi:putative ABC transport system ATP-binding protein